MTGDETRRSTERRDLLDDCRLMLSYALESGLALPVDLQRDLAELDTRLRDAGIPTVADLPPNLRDGVATEPSQRSSTTATGESSAVVPEESGTPPAPAGELVLRVHVALSAIVAPATALTLSVTEPVQGRSHVLARMPTIVRLAAILALLSATTFVLSAAMIASRSASSADAAARATSTATSAAAGGGRP